jgi:hypothetical protein
MLKINRKVWSVIEKNNLNNVQVFTNINTFKSSISVVFSSAKDYKVFVKQFDYKFGIDTAKLYPDMLEVIWEW